MKRRLLIALVIAIPISFFLGSPELERMRRESRAEKESIRLLRESSDKATLKDAVGDLGLFAEMADGSWLAIRYRDRHGFPMWSSAVALDSEGNWYRSNEHYCGRFMHYRRQKQRNEEDREDARKKNVPQLERDEFNEFLESRLDKDFVELEAAPTLEEARKVLERLGFAPFTP